MVYKRNRAMVGSDKREKEKTYPLELEGVPIHEFCLPLGDLTMVTFVGEPLTFFQGVIRPIRSDHADRCARTGLKLREMK